MDSLNAHLIRTEDLETRLRDEKEQREQALFLPTYLIERIGGLENELANVRPHDTSSVHLLIKPVSK